MKVEKDQIDYWRIVYDNAFNLIVMILVVELVAGIIIDKFGDLRSRNENIDNDSFSNCFICGKLRDKLDAQEGGFENHIKQFHNMWEYIFFIGYLREKQTMGIVDLSEAESKILELSSDQSLEQEYFPCYKEPEVEDQTKEIREITT
jgi:hypothetical protein